MEKYLKALLIISVFAIGFGMGNLIGILLPTAEGSLQTKMTTSRALSIQPVMSASSETAPLQAVPKDSSADGPIERLSPSDWIKENQIEMRQDGVFIHLNNPQWAVLANTNSMDPVFDETSHLIQIFPTTQDQIHPGDIISYQSPLGYVIVHRIIEINNDENGWYAIVKGDNNPAPDPWKVRFDWVKRITVMVIY